MQIIAVINQKGGVGKTTTTANLAHAISLSGRNVTVIDLDPQGHLTAHLGYASDNEHGAGDIISNGAESVEQYCIEARERLNLLPAGLSLKQVEVGSGHTTRALEKFANILRTSFAKEDYVFIDCPPASGLLIQYALTAADAVLVPVASDYLALRGLSDLILTLRNYTKEGGSDLKQWIVLTRFHMRRNLSHEVRDKLLEYFPGKILATPIRETAALAECPGFGKTVFEYRSWDNGADDYSTLAADFLKQRFM